jgi:Kdo2-lipid IVA lauroyltransferase/acyltransferase
VADPLRRRVRAKFLRAASITSGILPEWLARGGLEQAAWLSRFTRHEKRILENLTRAYKGELDAGELQRIASGVRRHSARIFYEWLRLSRGSELEGAWLDSVVRTDSSLQILDEAVANGRGALIVTAHIGNWELLAATLVRRGIRGAVVGLERKRDPGSIWLSDMRRAYGVETIPQHSHPRELMRVLEGGGSVGLVCDLEVRRLAGEFLPFFEVPALTMIAPAALARARRLPLIPVRCVLPEPGSDHYLLRVEEPIERDWSLPRREATSEHMQRVLGIFERWIRETPEQWAWHQARWQAKVGQIDALPLGAPRD